MERSLLVKTSCQCHLNLSVYPVPAGTPDCSANADAAWIASVGIYIHWADP